MTLYSRTGDSLDRGLVAFWPLDDLKSGPETDIAIDYANFNNAVITTKPLNSKGIFGSGYSMDFDGTDDILTMENSSGEIYNNTDFTVSLWFNQDGTNTAVSTQYAFTHGATFGDGNRIYISYTGVGLDLNFSIVATSNSFETMVSGRWYNAVMTRDRDGECNFYLNGIRIGRKNIDPGSSTEKVDMRIGRLNTSSDQAFNGKISNVRFYNRVLNQAEVSKLMRLRK